MSAAGTGPDVTEPSEAVAGPSRAGPARRRATDVTLVLALALASLAAGVPIWMTTAGSTVLQARVPVAVPGTQAAPAVTATALVLLAAGAAIPLVGRIGRWVVVVVVMASGGLLAASALAVIADPDPVAGSAVAGVTGVATLAAPVTLTVAPFAVVALGIAGVLLGGWLTATSRTWARPSKRHEGAGSPPPGPPDDDQSAWDALTRGNDPT